MYSTTKRDKLNTQLLQHLQWATAADVETGHATEEENLQQLDKIYNYFKKVHNDIMAITGDSEKGFQEIESSDALRIAPSGIKPEYN